MLYNGKRIKLFPMSPEVVRQIHREFNPPKKESFLLTKDAVDREIARKQPMFLLHIWQALRIRNDTTILRAV